MALGTSQRELWARIASFPLDLPNHPLTFTERLRREQAWPAAFAARVVNEYRRFLLLAATGETMMVPSDAVDQAWHLHLIDTRAYWDGLCGTAIGKPIHHTPSRGGRAEHARHRDAYAATLERYRSMFDEAPPADIWPRGDERFGGRWRRVDLERAWVVPKLRLRSAGTAVLTAALLAGCAAAKTTTLFDVFLLTLLAIGIALVARGAEAGHARRDRGGSGGCGGASGCSCPGGDGGGCSGGCGGCG